MLQEEDLIDMMHLLDSDGDGEVTKDEFKPFLMRVKQWTDESDFEREWKKIDLNGDNVLQLSELCDYYGVDTSAVVAGCEKRRDMTDEQVLEALQRQSEVRAPCRIGGYYDRNVRSHTCPFAPLAHAARRRTDEN